ncbi:hypothetical protein OVN20_08555 [Microcella daejeonensis]|nr:hypothetical protein [Microcella daejeonensis]WAB83145.1 hypothetical protein OVN20_08555 [Microcella daejeonensis]
MLLERRGTQKQDGVEARCGGSGQAGESPHARGETPAPSPEDPDRTVEPVEQRGSRVARGGEQGVEVVDEEEPCGIAARRLPGWGDGPPVDDRPEHRPGGGRLDRQHGDRRPAPGGREGERAERTAAAAAGGADDEERAITPRVPPGDRPPLLIGLIEHPERPAPALIERGGAGREDAVAPTAARLVEGHRDHRGQRLEPGAIGRRRRAVPVGDHDDVALLDPGDLHDGGPAARRDDGATDGRGLDARRRCPEQRPAVGGRGHPEEDPDGAVGEHGIPHHPRRTLRAQHEMDAERAPAGGEIGEQRRQLLDRLDERRVLVDDDQHPAQHAPGQLGDVAAAVLEQQPLTTTQLGPKTAERPLGRLGREIGHESDDVRQRGESREGGPALEVDQEYRVLAGRGRARPPQHEGAQQLAFAAARRASDEGVRTIRHQIEMNGALIPHADRNAAGPLRARARELGDAHRGRESRLGLHGSDQLDLEGGDRFEPQVDADRTRYLEPRARGRAHRHGGRSLGGPGHEGRAGGGGDETAQIVRGRSAPLDDDGAGREPHREPRMHRRALMECAEPVAVGIGGERARGIRRASTGSWGDPDAHGEVRSAAGSRPRRPRGRERSIGLEPLGGVRPLDLPLVLDDLALEALALLAAMAAGLAAAVGHGGERDEWTEHGEDQHEGAAHQEPDHHGAQERGDDRDQGERHARGR